MVSPMLAKNFDPAKHEKQVVGWHMSEKLDGVRAIFDGKDFYTRNGNRLHAPWRFVGPLTKINLNGRLLDGELYIGRGHFQECCGIVRRHEDEWFDIQFHMFDIVGMRAPFQERDIYLADIHDSFKDKIPHLFHVEQVIIPDTVYMYGYQEALVRDGAEGLMLKNPLSFYQQKRSGDLLKLKKFIDIDVKCIGYEEGRGKYAGMIGSLICRLADGRLFNVGSGLVDSQRDLLNMELFEGATITVKFFEYTKDGVPRFPIFKGIRDDV